MGIVIMKNNQTAYKFIGTGFSNIESVRITLMTNPGDSTFEPKLYDDASGFEHTQKKPKKTLQESGNCVIVVITFEEETNATFDCYHDDIKLDKWFLLKPQHRSRSYGPIDCDRNGCKPPN